MGSTTSIKSPTTGLKSKLNPTLEKYFQDYASSHQTRGNKISHAIGIPTIVISSLGTLSHLGTPQINVGLVSLLAVLLWFLSLDWKLTIPFGMAAYLCYQLGTMIPHLGLTLLFAIGWISQLLGHSVYEKKQPSFLANLKHLVIGPFWFVAKIIRY